jgi:SAM-dependent methyltransferase
LAGVIDYHGRDMQVNIAPAHPLTGNFRELDRNRAAAQDSFGEWIAADPRMKGRVLDVGCSDEFPRRPSILAILKAAAQVDGVDPTPAVFKHPGLTERWHAPFEDAPVPGEAYDALFAFWVAEHIEHPDRFLQKAYRALKPGGVLYAFTPHALHPFPLGVRLLEAMKLKRIFKRVQLQSETFFPAYYRMNRAGSVAPRAERAGFKRAEFLYLPAVQWDKYFPAPLRFVPHVYDRLLGIRFRRFAQIIAFRLEK